MRSKSFKTFRPHLFFNINYNIIKIKIFIDESEVVSLKGKFITFEGLDGSGKTTVIHKIKQYFEDQKRNDQILYEREPGSNRISEAIRNIALSEKYPEMDARTEALLYAAARRQHLVESVFPALKTGKIVISDRFVDSSLAYQGGGRQIGVQKVASINQFATDGLTPDLTFYLDIDPLIGLQRIHTHRENEVNRLDNEKLDFYQRVHQTYLQLARQNPQRIKTIDAAQPLEVVFKQVLAFLKEFLEKDN